MESVYLSGDGDGGGTAAVVTLGQQNLVVVGTELHAELGPGVEVVAGGHGTAGALALTDGPVLVEGLGAGDGGLVHLSVLVDVVVGTVAVDGALVLHARAGVVGAVVLEDVVLDQGTLGPTVDTQVSITRGLEVGLELDVAKKKK